MASTPPPEDDSKRQKHVEVVARIRPLTVTKESSTSFFEKTPSKRSSNLPRKPQIPSRLGRFRGGVSNNNTNTPSKESPPATPTTASSSNGSSSAIYAWDVYNDDTAKQSEMTDLVPGRTHMYTLDRVYGPDTSTRDLYQKSVQGLVQAAMDGYHSAVLAYGQTSTGKTHTMTGTGSQPGLIPLAIRECFQYYLHANSAASAPREYLLRVSYLEIYKEHIRDLLAPSEPPPPPVRMFDSVNGQVIKGLREEVVTNAEQVFAHLRQGEARRQVGATHMNQHSSRSHVMVRLWIESRDASAGGAVRISSLSLVDLAGSESVKLTGSSDRRQEGHYINKSLMTLGQVVNSLSEQATGDSKKHVPYRDSKLTRLLQPSLSGNAQMVLICCISPMTSHIEESHNTFKFATRAKKIPQKATITEGGADDKTLLQAYREEIEDLKLQLQEARANQERLMQEKRQQLDTVTEGDEEEVQELVKAIHNMEELILKSKPGAPSAVKQPEDLLDGAGEEEDDDAEDDLMGLMDNLAISTPTKTPRSKQEHGHDDLQKELFRIQGLLGSVLKKRTNGDAGKTTEVRNLKAQLEEQQVASSLRKADSSFLQAQLAEKDALLQEISKLLEAVEERQTRLEAENASLKKELEELMASRAEI